MGAIHELLADYRHYRSEHPKLRFLFFIGDLLSLLFKLAVFAGFMYLCWYVVSRDTTQPNRVASDSVIPVAAESQQLDTNKQEAIADAAIDDATAPELTAERIALLEKIAGRKESSGLIGSVSGINAATADTPQPVVQVESGLASSAGYVEIDEIPTVVVGNIETSEISEARTFEVFSSEPVSAEFADNIFLPAGDLENGNWLLRQDGADYTVQLALTSNVEFLVSFANKLPSEHRAAVYPERLTDSGKVQYSLSLGSFSSIGSAEAVLSSLSSSQKRYGAHVRKIDEAQQQVTSFLR